MQTSRFISQVFLYCVYVFVIDSDDYDWGKENPQKIYNLGLNETAIWNYINTHCKIFVLQKGQW